jgi:NAD+-dependent secondary alcohol dehydrogenase Adh1
VTRQPGSYFAIGQGGTLHIPTLSIKSSERNTTGNSLGTDDDLAQLSAPARAQARAGRVTLHTRTSPLAAAGNALADPDAGRARGRTILVP